jgi:hypothetical protein
VARSRSRPRRRRINLLIAIIVTVALVVLARDVQHVAERSAAHRTSLNLAFAALARAVLANEHVFELRADALLIHGSTMSRPRFAGQMDLDLLEGRQVVQEVDLLADPTVDDNAQARLITVVNDRVTGVTELLSDAAASLLLPHPMEPWPGVTAVQASLAQSNTVWASTQLSFATAPGRAQLVSSDFSLASAPLATDLSTLRSSSTLAPTRGVTIATVAVVPSPFPSSPRILVLPPAMSMAVDVVTRNRYYINQQVTVTVSIEPIGPGFARTRTQHLALAPLGSFAADFGRIPIGPNERATLTITLLGAPVAVGGIGTMHFTVEVAPSPTS